ncbi:pectin acetylesterase 7-like isoform X1 [Nicotiana tabacum]|uniref:Pectin acetylesterase 7-like isoform X1 n=2 Tax=Nicotiana tabacum TaxID=4097 RepID=A0AC58TYV9_TOBAC
MTNPEVIQTFTIGMELGSDIAMCHRSQDTKLYYRGARIFRAIMNDLSRKGMQTAENAILRGTSAGGLATILNCDKFKSLLPNDVRVKCVADSGFFINAKTISGTLDIQDEYWGVVTLHVSPSVFCFSKIYIYMCV